MDTKSLLRKIDEPISESLRGRIEDEIAQHEARRRVGFHNLIAQAGAPQPWAPTPPSRRLGRNGKGP